MKQGLRRVGSMRRSYVAPYARARGISRQGMLKLLRRAGIDYHRPFSWDEVDRLLDSYRDLSRDHLRKRWVRNPDG